MHNPTTRNPLLTLNTAAIVGFVGFCERYEEILRGEWEDEAQREMVIESLKVDWEEGKTSGALRYDWGSDFCEEGVGGILQGVGPNFLHPCPSLGD